MGLSVAASAVYYDYVSCTGWQKILVLQIVSRTGAAVQQQYDADGDIYIVARIENSLDVI